MVVDPISIPAAANAAITVGSHALNFAKAFLGETNSSVTTKFQESSKNNEVFRAVAGPVSVDSPVLACLYNTFNNNPDRCPSGNYVFYTGRNMGKSTALRIFCSKTLKKASRRSIYVSGLGPSQFYFENVANNLGVEYNGTNWAKSLVAAMGRAPNNGALEAPPVLFLDEFNDLGVNNENRNAMNVFMRECLNKDFYLIIATSKENVADELVYLNGWGKILPLQAVHNGSVFENHEEGEKPSWKDLSWSIDQLQKVAAKHVKGNLGTYDFLHDGMDPYQAIQAAKLYREQQTNYNLETVSDEEF